MKTCIVIPARMGSTRFPSKPLRPIQGPDGAKPLVQYVWENARACTKADRVIIATDHEAIQRRAEAFGAEVFTTSPDHKNGTERVAEVQEILEKEGIFYDHYVNLQGDAPLIGPQIIGDLIDFAKGNPYHAMCTATFKANSTPPFQKHVSIALTDNQEAIYFSRQPVPYQHGPAVRPRHYHLGIYAMTALGLAEYGEQSEGRLEKTEGLEQLRWLETLGVFPKVLKVSAAGGAYLEVNHPEDVTEVEARLWAQA